ncbi:hypothetical protein [Anaerosinus massiliensis]|uniref:hypothetical protein n=1 Tax=Massilibacillus massiliensis TaxID=1806837 RepID=UPI000DA63007|nr:hypothetical protein [Massilibacillus massiliensis]
MEKIIFDTNMFYNYLELRENTVQKLKLKEIVQNYDSYLTSVTVAEVVIYFRKNFKVIKTVFDSIDKDFSYINTSNLSIENEEIDFIKNSTSLDEISDLIDNIQVRKIKIEAEFTAQIFYSILSIILFCIIDTNSTCINQSIKIREFFKEKLTKNPNFFVSRYRNLYINGYQDRSAKKIVKAAFDSDIKRFTLILLCKFYLGNSNTINLPEQDDLFLWISNKKNRCSVFKNSKYKNALKNNLLFLKMHLENEPIFKNMDITLNHFMKKVIQTFYSDAKLKTNDIADLLILYCLYAFEDKNVVILTHDKDMQKTLKESENYSVDFMKKHFII